MSHLIRTYAVCKLCYFRLWRLSLKRTKNISGLIVFGPLYMLLIITIITITIITVIIMLRFFYHFQLFIFTIAASVAFDPCFR